MQFLLFYSPKARKWPIEVFKSVGILPVVKVKFMMHDNGTLNSDANCLTTRGMMLS